MNEMIERAVKALELAIEIPEYVLKYCVESKNWHVEEISTTVFYSFTNHEEAEILCKKLNNECVVKKIIESLKGDVPYYETDKIWRELTSTKVWNLCLDKILSGD